MGAYRKPSDWPSVKNMTVYATMQPGWLIAAPSMGTSGVSSASGALEMVKSDAKESIDVFGRVSREMLVNLSDAERLIRALLLYLVSLT